VTNFVVYRQNFVSDTVRSMWARCRN